MTEPQGLRERKKQATRATLSHLAWAQMLQKGMDAVSPESVADAAEVSARTFRNYFTSVEEAIVEGAVHRVVDLTDALHARPAGEPAWDALTNVLPEAISALVGERENVVVLLRATRQNPALRGAHLDAFEGIQRRLSEAIAERTDGDPACDLLPRLLAAAVGAALRTSIEVWASSDGATDLADLVRRSLDQLRAGIPRAGAAPPTP